MQKVKSRVQLE